MKHRGLIALLLIMALGWPINIVARGQVSILQAYQKEPIAGGELTLFYIGSLHDDRVLLKDGQTFELEALRNQLITNQGFIETIQAEKWESQTIDQTGLAVFNPRQPGVYLVQHTQVPNGYLPALPAVFSYEDQEMTIHLKMSPHSIMEETTSDRVIAPPESIPLTGQNWWPVIVLSLIGGSLVAVSFLIQSPLAKKEGVDISDE